MVKMKKAFLFILSLILCFSLFACKDSEEKADEKGDNSKYYDSITKTLTLTKSYTGKSFLTDGIGLATIEQYTDGDTARFALSSGESISVRLYEIDTPESTGSVEKWGKAASLFFKTQIEQATTIVLEATADKAQKDSYGTRYLGYVWYKTEESTEFKNLNLEIVENGFSKNKGIGTSAYPYYSYFANAEAAARKMELRLFSDEDDPLYSTEPVEMTLEAFYANNDLFYSTDTETGACVKTTLYLSELKISSTQTYTFVGSELNTETGETKTINIYVGHAKDTGASMSVGNLYELIGDIQLYNRKFQISGINYQELLTSGSKISTLKQSNYYLTFDSNRTFDSAYGGNMFGDATVVSASVSGSDLSVVATAQRRNTKGYVSTVSTFTFIIKDAASRVNTFVEGSKFSTVGYQLVANSGNITVYGYSKITFR